MSDPFLEKGFNHPCRETCSGWQQGYDRGLREGLSTSRIPSKIDWKLVWDGVNAAVQKFTRLSLTEFEKFDSRVIIQQLVEKQLAGEK